MKTELSKIAQDLEKGVITNTEARTLLSDLLIVSDSVLNTNKLRVVEGGYGYYKLYQNKEYLMEGELLEVHERVRAVIEAQNQRQALPTNSVSKCVCGGKMELTDCGMCCTICG